MKLDDERNKLREHRRVRKKKMEDEVIEAGSLSVNPGEKEHDHHLKDGDEDKPSGLIKHIMSNLGFTGEVPKAKEKDEEEKHEKEGDGLLDHLSNLVSPLSEDVARVKTEEVSEVAEKEQKETGKEEEEEEGGGSIIENIVSHLPKSFPDDAAPTTDEASILIHCIVHD